MNEVSIIGLDIAKNVFQVHGIDCSGEPVVRRQLKRGRVLAFFGKLTPCLVGMEACATLHYWAREISKLGHDVRMMPPRYVKPHLKRNKHHAADAEAFCEAVQRPIMRFVPIKSPVQQSVLMLHRTRQLFVQQRTTPIKAICAHIAEFGIVAGVGRNGVEVLLRIVAEDEDQRIPPQARAELTGTQSAESIMASGRVKCRINRPNTWRLQPAGRNQSKPLTVRSQRYGPRRPLARIIVHLHCRETYHESCADRFGFGKEHLGSPRSGRL
ncbi:MAG: IS110 family transposase [Rhizobiales bacterium]|nr:IS110 family transposase [Hyphomicrobiales bacterium]